MLFEQLALFRLPAPEPVAKSRQLLIQGRIVDYQLKTGARRLSLTIDERGLRVASPARTRLGEIEAFVHEHGSWVVQKLNELASSSGPRHINIKDGARLPLLDTDIEVRVLPGANRIRWIGNALVLEARPDADLTALARRGLQKRALEHFTLALDRYTAQLGLAAPKLGLSSARTRWGSCSSESGIRINWRLIHMPAHLSDYVIAHEVAHLLEMNHSPRFWAVVTSLYPEWKAARSELKQRAASLPIL